MSVSGAKIHTEHALAGRLSVFQISRPVHNHRDDGRILPPGGPETIESVNISTIGAAVFKLNLVRPGSP